LISRCGKQLQNEQPSFQAQELRRGFLGDKTFERVVSYLVARGALEWMETYVAIGKRSEILTDLSLIAERDALFRTEVSVLEALKTVRITNRMLEGS
jgi:hypothetical protein